MASNFFTNQGENTLYNKFVGVFENMQNIEYFKSVIGYFRASGYFAIRKHFPADLKVKIIAGIDVDPFIALAQKQGLLFNLNAKDAKQSFYESIQEDILNAKYGKNIEEGILQLIQDIGDGRIEIRAHNSKKLHSKFYIFLSPNFNEHNPNGMVIMGSSNLSAQGLGLEDVEHNYEMNIELRDYENVLFADTEFEELWLQSTPILPVDASALLKKTYLEVNPTPFELYVKFLIEFFGKNIEYDPDSISDIPLKKFKKLSYQVEAVNQGYELLLKYNGFFLADVVGTGKTVMAALLAKKFYLTNGPKTRILVVYPPALEKNWTSTFKDFEIQNYCDFITNGSLDKIIDGKFKNDKEHYDLILVDEAHKFRNHKSQQFQNLQIICKSGREFIGGVEGFEKKVVLISATPLNNKPDDIYRLLTLFQDERNCTLPSVPEQNLQKYFYPLTQKYKEEISQNPINLASIQEIFNNIRDKVIKDITIRRTRTDLQKNDRYRKDLIDQKIYFPKVAEPFTNKYELPPDFAELFLETFNTIIDKNKIDFYRYQAIAYLTDEANNGTYQNAETISKSLASIMHNQLIKRLESSFYAFKKSLQKITTSTGYMIEMYENNKVYIAPDASISVTDMMDRGYTDEEIEFEMQKKNDEFNPRNRTFEQKDFDRKDKAISFIDGLKKDFEYLTALNTRWQAIEEKNDPKWDVFVALLKSEYFNTDKNELGKLVIFTESVDTLTYLKDRLNSETTHKVLSITAENRNRDFEIIRENFDANYEKAFKNDYDIILTTDVLAEGINLHRANVIVNYDTPWNPTKLIQRLGRINRIGSKANFIYNYNFYPSEQGDDRINLKNRSLGKLQSSHSAYGEDNKIYSLQEIIEQWGMFDPDKKDDDVDIRSIYLEFLRKFKEQNPEHFTAIKKMPLKIRCIRELKTKNEELKMKEKDLSFFTFHSSLSIAFVKNGDFKNIYLHTQNKSYPLPFEKAVKVFEAKKTEEGILPIPEIHYKHINHILNQFEKDITTPEMVGGKDDTSDVRTQTSVVRLSNWLADTLSTEESKQAAINLLPLLKNGTYANLTNEVYKLRNEPNANKLELELIALSKKYTS
ncbi:MAG: DEAD/DEAH box helicase family protein, partial [Bacteroidetes bacterium]|nr:DEAD/DEAH box helicase family protein [Bacteroidota bacterium]